jgi:protocatechuate 3,4-dioxygenase beta subunit
LEIQNNRSRRLFTRMSIVIGLAIMMALSIVGMPVNGQALAQATPAATAAGTQTAIDLPAPTCTAPAAITQAVTEGPFYKANTPERTSLVEPGVSGTKIIVTGYVLGTDCKPIAHAWLDFWQADGEGAYDNAGYKLRGHQYTDENGRYVLETVLPGEYPGRTNHIHVKVQAPRQQILTSQLFFPGEPGNDRDGIFDKSLIVSVFDAASGTIMQATALPTAAATSAAGEAEPVVYVYNFVVAS